MASNVSASWLMAGQAIDGMGDPHLAKGVHFRIVTHPGLGLPIVPFVVQKGTWRRKELSGIGRTDVTWVSAQGQVLTPPFEVTSDNPVTAHVPLGGDCCWATLLARPAGRDREASGLRLTALVGTPLGDAPVAVSSRAPWDVYASHIERIVVSGRGYVVGIQWVSARDLTGVPFRLEPLPAKSGARYSGPADGADTGRRRIIDGAPQRVGLHDDPDAAGPGACAPVGQGDEDVRLAPLVSAMAGTLDRCLGDLSAPVTDLVEDQPVIDEQGVARGTASRPILIDLLHGLVDPGFARWMGYLDVDEDPSRPTQDVEPLTDGDIVGYLVTGAFAPVVESFAKQDWALVASSATSDLDSVLGELKSLDERIGGLDGPHGVRGMPLLTARVALLATIGHPLDTPVDPVVTRIDAREFLPTTPPEARRALEARLDRIVPAAGLASVLRQPPGGPSMTLNAKDPVGRHQLVTSASPPDALTSSVGLVTTRRAGEQDGTWSIAQSDWFGRWSGWGVGSFGAASRPRPPRPVVALTGAPPAAPPPSGPAAGTIRIEVAVPPLASLPVGGLPLERLTCTIDLAGVPMTSVEPLPDPLNPPTQVVVNLPGPDLAPTTQGTVTVTATWSDTAGTVSDPSEPKQVVLYDPRPPSAVAIPPTLTYTARPDATGRARARLVWPVVPGQASFRVFVSDETSLSAKLRDIAAGNLATGDAGLAPSAVDAQAILDALAAAGDDAPARGAVWDTHRGSLPRRWWLQLTGDPVPAPAAGPATFTHDVSASLTVLVLYRVVAVSTASVESNFASSPLLPRAVPNAFVPTVPTVTVRPRTDAAGNLLADLTVTVARGVTPAARYRIRRATTTTEAHLMPVVAEGTLPALPPPDPASPPAPGDPQVFVVTDTGDGIDGPHASLSPWRTYQWRVEVAGPALPGGGPVAEWSRASAACSTTLMPPTMPATVTDLSVSRDGAGDIHVRFRHPETLAAGSTTGYLVDIYRADPGDRLHPVASLPGHAPVSLGGRGSAVEDYFDVTEPGAMVPAGAVYQVVVTDPIGRASVPSPAKEAP